MIYNTFKRLAVYILLSIFSVVSLIGFFSFFLGES